MVSRRCPYQSDLSESENESPYQNDQNRWDLNELKWIEVNRGEMSDLMDLMRSTLWKSPYEMNEGVPIKVTWFVCCDQILSKWMESMRNEWIEWNEMKWVIWWILLCEPYEKVPMVERECPYQNDLICLLWPNPFKMIRIDEKWVNWVKWSEMSDLMDLTWNNPMRKSLWSSEGEPYRSDLMWVKMNVPIKMNGIDEKWMNWSE